MTPLADQIAARVREWYEAHREDWLTRLSSPGAPDEFMLALVSEVQSVVSEMTPPMPPVQPHAQQGHKKAGRK